MSDFTAASLRIVSYNILADCYVKVPDQPWNAFSHCSEEHISFSDRCPRIMENLIQSDADVIVLQEVMFEFRDELWQLPEYLVCALQGEHGYTPVMQGLKQKEIAKNALRNEKMVGKAIPTGLAIFWKTEKFTEFDVSKYGSGSGMTVYLQIRGTDSLFCVNNIHLVGDPLKFDQHLKQLEGAKKQLENKKVLESIKDESVSCVYEFICGDFNGEVAVVSSATTGTEEEDSDGKSDCVQRTTVGEWFHENSFTRAPTGTSWASDSSASVLDHVMYRCRCPSLRQEEEGATEHSSLPPIVCFRCVPEEQSHDNNEVDASLVGGLPNRFHPSDHVMLQVDFQLNL
jgi:mRNA deadenylase 3'-5' endonuclease subunit Ccr4